MAPSQGKPLHGLIADDDSLIRMVVCTALQEHGFSVVEADSGQAAIDTSDSIDFAVIDARMPGLSLVQTVSGLRAAHWIPVLVISGGVVDEVLPDDVDYLAKPFDLPQLLLATDRLVGVLPDRGGS